MRMLKESSNQLKSEEEKNKELSRNYNVNTIIVYCHCCFLSNIVYFQSILDSGREISNGKFIKNFP